MRKILIAFAVAIAFASAAGSARAEDKPKSTDKAATPWTEGKDTAKTPSDAKSLSGSVQSVDVPGMAITIVSPTGDVQHITVAADAPVVKDGSASSFDQIKQGDNVRASLDSKSNKASRIEVKSKSGSAPQK